MLAHKEHMMAFTGESELWLVFQNSTKLEFSLSLEKRILLAVFYIFQLKNPICISEQ